MMINFCKMNSDLLAFLIVVCSAVKYGDSENLPCGPHSVNYHRYHFEGTCYFTYKSMFDTIDWNKAESACVKQGGHLASFHSQAEWQFIKESIAKQELWYKDSYWIGMKSSGAGPFRWSDNTTVDFAPDTTLDSSSVINAWQRCVYVARSEWKEANCHLGNFLDFSYICKISPPTVVGADNSTSAVKIDGECMDGWTKHENWCRKVFGYDESEWMSWSSALTRCKLYHPEGSLVTAHSAADQAEITSAIRGLRRNPWIGLKRVLGEYRWADITALKGFDNWDGGEPTAVWGSGDLSAANSGKICVTASVNKLKAGKWVTTWNCSEARPFVCQILPDKNVAKKATKLDGPCRVNGYVAYATSCYKVFENERLDWSRAEARCQEDGGRLTSINDAFEQSFVETLTRKSSSRLLWTGLSSAPNDAKYKWSDGEPLTFDNRHGLTRGPEAVNWGKCVALARNESEWITLNCATSIPFICRVKNITGPREDSSALNGTTPAPTAKECPYPETVSWIDVGTPSCFYLETKRLGGWEEGHRECSSQGGSLANPRDSVERQKVLSAIVGGDSIWIGFYEDEEDGIRWTDSVPFNSLVEKPESSVDKCFQILNAEEFLNCLTNDIIENREQFRCGLWNTTENSFVLTNDCQKSRPFLCQLAKVATVPTSPPSSGVSSGSRSDEAGQPETTSSLYRYNVTGRKEKALIDGESQRRVSEASADNSVVIVVPVLVSLLIAAVAFGVWRYRTRRSRYAEREHSFTNNLFESSDGTVLSFTNGTREA